jgi:serine/threonine protein kinase
LNPATNYTPPPTFGRFRLQHQIGAGVLGPVFRTEDPENGSVVAVKAFVLDITPERAQDLAGEFQHLIDVNLRHPRIAHAIAAGVEGAVPYLAQQYVDAESLDVAIRQYGPAPFPDAVRLITHIAEALDEAARLEISHGSLHPRDVLVTPGNTHVTGIGVAGALERIGWRTPVRRPYAAPEREMTGSWATAADVFGLAAIAYEVLTGRRAMPGTDEPLPGLNDLRAADPAALREALESALDRDPHRRPATAHDLVRSIAVGLVGASAAAAESGDGRMAAKGQRRVRTKAPRLPGLEDPLIAKAADTPPSEPGGHQAPEPFAIEPAFGGEPAASAFEAAPVELDVPAFEPPRSLTPIDFSSLELPPARQESEPDTAPDFSALEVGRPSRVAGPSSRRDVALDFSALEGAAPSSSPDSGPRPPLAIDDLRLSGSLVTEPLVPRAIDPGTQTETPFRRPEPLRDRSGWGLPAMAATLSVGIAIGLLAGYQFGARRSVLPSDAPPAADSAGAGAERGHARQRGPCGDPAAA